jgi:hypothetical protein
MSQLRSFEKKSQNCAVGTAQFKFDTPNYHCREFCERMFKARFFFI